MSSEAQQIETIRNFMKSYGVLIVGGIFATVVGVGGWSYWQQQKSAEYERSTATVQQLMNDTQQADVTTALSGFAGTADKITQEAPDSAQAILAQLVIADQAYQREDYASAEKALLQVDSSKVDDEGLVAIVHLRLANVQVAQDKLDDALATLAKVKTEAFTSTVEERKGDIYVAKKDTESAQKAYQTAWDSLLKREEDSAILRMKLESVGVQVDEPNFPQPILTATMETPVSVNAETQLTAEKE